MLASGPFPGARSVTGDLAAVDAEDEDRARVVDEVGQQLTARTGATRPGWRMGRYSVSGAGHSSRMCSQLSSSGDSPGAMYRAPGNVCAGAVKLPLARSRPMFAR